MRDVYVAGVAHTHFGEHWDHGHRALLLEAGLGALQDAKMSGDDIDAAYLGTMGSGAFLGQEHIAPMLMDDAGLAGNHIPVTRVEAAGASGALAFRQAYLAIASGAADRVVIGGLEKMTDVSDQQANAIGSSAIDREWELANGATKVALHALIAKQHMAKHGTSREAFAHFSALMHVHGARNPLAQFQRATTKERVMAAPFVSEPLGVFDCAPLSDGAACVVLTSERAEGRIRVAGSGHATDTMRITDRPSQTAFAATRVAAERALAQAQHEIHDMDLLEVFDTTTVGGLLALQDLGLYEPAQVGKAILDDAITYGGDVVVNPGGGLKARGHPIGATGVAQICELTWHLRATAGDRQVAGAKRGLAHAVGGIGSSSLVHVLEASA